MTTNPPLISTADLNDLLGDPRLRIVDATVHLTFDQDGAHVESGSTTFAAAHLPGAVFIDQITELSNPAGEAAFAAADSQAFAGAVGAHGIGDDSRVVVYDTVNGIWATRLWWQFRLEGRDVEVLDGGLGAWRSAGLPTTTEVTTYEPAVFTATRRDDVVVSTADVEAATTDESVLLVNALDPETFAQGHIPGSVNVPFGSLVDADGRLRGLDELREIFAAAGALDADVRPVTYCGGGIAATAVTLALTALGRDDVAVYDGSMNAWTADPRRPLGTA
ncbi:sulfurtransferase [Aeromicrobium chenweiae]|uniref:Sulfurtransferase n=1 Tax=Aeromicrobium chenweiae TaxID=2079793 RepID=A0A2S0WM25_9ACTN|nr:sulfurtransferase [Aeromicrobium chenweiae]AWB92320.1 sulfurtransferase [Aeromicrobium chenweiae]TGN31394.1 sulfurtransferase [Aeromicrobium chenweiae]